MSKLADDLERLCCAETEGKFFDCVTDNIQTIVAALRSREICRRFIADQEITCPETIYQTDRVIENAPEFIEQICELIGYADQQT